MDSLERRLIELNEALLRLAAGQKPTEEMVMNAQRAISGASINFDTGPGNDTVIINKIKGGCADPQPGPPGPPGPPGEQGPPGPPGEQGPPGSCDCNKITVSEDFQASCNNYYIGVNSEDSVTITLPVDCDDCCELIIKAEMGPPLGNRKVTITTADGSLIDGKAEIVLTTPYEYVRLICNEYDWRVVG